MRKGRKSGARDREAGCTAFVFLVYFNILLCLFYYVSSDLLLCKRGE